MLLSLFTIALIVLLAMTNWDHVLLFSSWLYSFASRWVTTGTSTILVLYGFVLVYLLLVVHSIATTQSATRKRRKNHLVPYYDENGVCQPYEMKHLPNQSSFSRATSRFGAGGVRFDNKFKWCVVSKSLPVIYLFLSRTTCPSRRAAFFTTTSQPCNHPTSAARSGGNITNY